MYIIPEVIDAPISGSFWTFHAKFSSTKSRRRKRKVSVGPTRRRLAAPVASRTRWGAEWPRFPFESRPLFSCSSLWPGHCRPLLLVPSCLHIRHDQYSPGLYTGAHALLLRRCALSPANGNLLPSEVETKNRQLFRFQLCCLTFKGKLKFRI